MPNWQGSNGVTVIVTESKRLTFITIKLLHFGDPCVKALPLSFEEAVAVLMYFNDPCAVRFAIPSKTQSSSC